jgi:hypothetical protein
MIKNISTETHKQKMLGKITFFHSCPLITYINVVNRNYLRFQGLIEISTWGVLLNQVHAVRISEESVEFYHIWVIEEELDFNLVFNLIINFVVLESVLLNHFDCHYEVRLFLPLRRLKRFRGIFLFLKSKLLTSQGRHIRNGLFPSTFRFGSLQFSIL